MQWGRSLYPRPRKIDSRGSEDRASSPTESSRAFWRLAATLRQADERLPSRRRRRDLSFPRPSHRPPCRSNGTAGGVFRRQVRWTQWAAGG
jgi:hypothetical protein